MAKAKKSNKATPLTVPFKERAIAFDVETTGLSSKDDRIVELGFIIFDGGKEVERQSIRFNPEMKIPPVVIKIHGITDDDVKDCPVFSDMSKELREKFEDCFVVIGYKVDFDLKFIKAEFKRAKEKDYSWSNRLIIDPLKIWKNNIFDHKLTSAYKTFVGGKLEKAHAALADIEGTVLVANAMADKFKLGKTAKGIAEATTPEADVSPNVVSGDNRLVWGDKGQIVVNFTAEHRGKDLDKIDKGMLNWFMSKDFISPEIKKYVQIVLDGKKLPTNSSKK